MVGVPGEIRNGKLRKTRHASLVERIYAIHYVHNLYIYICHYILTLSLPVITFLALKLKDILTYKTTIKVRFTITHKISLKYQNRVSS
jgi:hypothetical protein